MVPARGAMAEIPVSIKNSFSLPCSFLEMTMRMMPRMRNINPRIPATKKKVL